ncbi:MAG: hypothetical protein Q4F41_16140 [Eubacteriales bacterium]|nr:hypothetical protein [Eubacteriales bacterium]
MISANLIINKGKYDNDDAIFKTINYISRLDNENIFYYGIWPPTKENSITLFEELRCRFPENTCPQKVQHFWITYKSLKDTVFINTFADRIAFFFAPVYPICFSTHNDKKHWHSHFVVSTTSYFPDQPPLIGATWRSYLNMVENFSLSNGILLKEMYKIPNGIW